MKFSIISTIPRYSYNWDNFSPYCRSEIFTLLPPDSTSSVLETWWRPWPLAPRAASCRDNSCHVPVLAGPWPPPASAFTRLLTSSYVSRRWLRRLCVGVHGLKKASGSKYLNPGFMSENGLTFPLCQKCSKASLFSTVDSDVHHSRRVSENDRKKWFN